MSINYSLYENKLPAANDSYAARVQNKGSIGLDEVANRIINLGTTVRKADILAVLENTCQVCEDALLEGTRVNLGGLFDMFTSIKGVFESNTDSFDPTRHSVEVATAPGTRVRKIVQENITVVKQDTILPAPSLLQFHDFGSDTTNTSITANKNGAIYGSKLKFDPAIPTEGIFFVDSFGVGTKVTEIQKNKPSELIFMNPALSGAENPYTLEVRVHFTENGDLRIGKLSGSMTSIP